MILILTGPTRSHKTTTLLQWSSRRSDCGGVLTPDRSGLRKLYNVKEKKHIPFQKREKKLPSDIEIGNFIFEADSFKKATVWLDEHLTDPTLNYVLIDEIGPLELQGKGWDQWISDSIPKLGDKTLILVVRRKILDEVIQRYHLEEVSVVEKEYFLPEGTEPVIDEIDEDDLA